MSNKKVINAFLNELWNCKNTCSSEMHQIFHDQVIIDSPIGKKIGRSSLQSINDKWLYAFPRMQVNNIELLEEQGTVVSIWNGYARHEDVFNGLQPTGKLIQYKGVTIFKFQNNVISKYQCLINMHSIYDQLGFVLTQNKYEEQNIICSNYSLLMKNIVKTLKVLTIREIECLSCWVNGRSAKETANIFSISYRTVEKYISNVMMKFNVYVKYELIDKIYETKTIFMLRDLYDIILTQHKAKLRGAHLESNKK